MRVLGVIILASCLAVAGPTRVRAGMEAPAVVVAEPGGTFEYQWRFVVETPFVVAALGSWDIDNTGGHGHGDCFCLEFCTADVGDTIRWTVTGNLVDISSPGLVSNWVSGCSAGGGSSTTTILPPSTTDVPGLGPGVGLRLWSHPNPSRGPTHFTYFLPAPGRTSLRLYDLTGRQVASLVDGVESAGAHTVVWDAGASGAPRPRGVYFARLVSAGRTRTLRIVIE